VLVPTGMSSRNFAAQNMRITLLNHMCHCVTLITQTCIGLNVQIMSYFTLFICLSSFPLPLSLIHVLWFPHAPSCLLWYSMPYLISFRKYISIISTHGYPIISLMCACVHFLHVFLSRILRYSSNLRIRKSVCKQLTFVVTGYCLIIFKHPFCIMCRS
jgi:hypothetical protein